MKVTIYGRSEELVSRCIECDLAEPETLASLGSSAPGLFVGILSIAPQIGAFLSQMHRSAFEGKIFMSLNMPWMTSAHLLPDDFNPYRALRNIRMYPSSSWNSGPAMHFQYQLPIGLGGSVYLEISPA